MNPWIKRSLLALAAATMVGGLAACGHGPMGGPRGDGPMACGPGGPMMGWHGGARGPMSEADHQRMRDRMVERATDALKLDAAQKGKLVALMDTMHRQRSQLTGAAKAGEAAKTPRDQLLGLMSGERFDRAGAQALADEKTQALRGAAPEVIAAMGDFYDSLKPEQQAQVREFMQRRGKGWRGGWRG